MTSFENDAGRGPEWLPEERLCIGCGLCVSLSGSGRMIESPTGWLVPRFDDCEPILAGDGRALVEAVCPSHTMTLSQDAPAPSGSPRERVWGRSLETVRSWATDDSVRHGGASGGVLTAIAGHLLESGAISSVIHVAPTAHVGRARSTTSTSLKELVAGNGSWYCPSPALEGLLPSSERPRAVIAKPCEVSATRRLRERRPDLVDPGDILLSFFCGGLPSRSATFELAESVGAKPAEVDQFRYRGEGWPGDTRFDGPSGSWRVGYETSWGQHLGREIHPLCKICPDSIGLAADVVVGDAWIIDGGAPTFVDRPGESVVMVRSAIGRRVYEGAKRAGVVADRSFAIDELGLSQALHYERRRLGLARRIGARLGGLGVPRAGRLGLRAASTCSPALFLRNLVGSARRAHHRNRRRVPG